MKQAVCTEGRLPLSSRKGGGDGKRWRPLGSWQQEALRFSGSTSRPFCSSMTTMPDRWRSSAALIVGKVGRSRGLASGFTSAHGGGTRKVYHCGTQKVHHPGAVEPPSFARASTEPRVGRLSGAVTVLSRRRGSWGCLLAPRGRRTESRRVGLALEVVARGCRGKRARDRDDAGLRGKDSPTRGSHLSCVEGRDSEGTESSSIRAPAGALTARRYSFRKRTHGRNQGPHVTLQHHPNQRLT
jgi:hypothetical protein